MQKTYCTLEPAVAEKAKFSDEVKQNKLDCVAVQTMVLPQSLLFGLLHR